MSRVRLERWLPMRGGPTLDAELGPGLRAACVEAGELCSKVLSCLGGIEPPHGGRVLVDGAEPARDPVTRRHLAVTLPHEPLTGAPGTVREALTRLRRLRPAPPSQRASWLLDAGGLERRMAELDPRERRRFALAVALETPAPRLVALHEPWRELTPEELPALLDSLDALLERGATVLVTCHERAWAERFDEAPLRWSTRQGARA